MTNIIKKKKIGSQKFTFQKIMYQSLQNTQQKKTFFVFFEGPPSTFFFQFIHILTPLEKCYIPIFNLGRT